MLRIVPHIVSRVGRSYQHFPDGFELHLRCYMLRKKVAAAAAARGMVRLSSSVRGSLFLRQGFEVRVRDPNSYRGTSFMRNSAPLRTRGKGLQV